MSQKSWANAEMYERKYQLEGLDAEAVFDVGALVSDVRRLCLSKESATIAVLDVLGG